MGGGKGGATRGRRILAACAGPALIVLGVLVALEGFVFHDRLTQAHPDVLTFWLPRFAYLGRSIAEGHIPLWNPYEMAGYRFAADPQGGWLYLTPMALFSTLSPAAAMRAFIVVNPLLAGLGLYGFCRVERLSRVAATVGGLSLAMLMSTSEIAVSMPFAGSIAWTTVALVGAAGYRRADRWSRRIAWLALGAFGWSQVATAHLSHGLVMCSVLVVAYLVSGAVADVRAQRVQGWAAAGAVLLFLVMLPLASLAVLLPRIDALQASSLAAGYDRLGDALGSLGGADSASIQANGVWAAWPLALGAAPGAYAGAVILLAVPLAVRARRHRALVWGVGGALVLTWVAMLDAVVTAVWFRSLLLRIPFGDVYLHNPGRMRYLAVIAIPILGAVGIQGLRDDPMPARRAALWLGGGAVLWLGVPLAAGATPARFALLAAGLVAGGVAVWLLATARMTWAWAAVVAVLSVELLVSVAWSHSVTTADTVLLGLEGGEHPNLIPQPLPSPEVDGAAFVAPTAFVPRLRASEERYLTWAPPAAAFDKGYLFMQLRPDWPALAMERGTLFSIRDPLGYNPVQLPRYWDYLRARTDLPVFYNAAVIDLPTSQDIGLLGVRYLVIPTGIVSPLPGTVVEQAQGYDLVELSTWQPHVSVVASWTVVDSTAAALRSVTAPGFDPASEAVLESDPGFQPEPGAEPGTASAQERSPSSLTIEATASAPSIVVVRSTYDGGWTATVDGEPADLVPVDGFLQGVPVGPGDHTIELAYEDEALTRGLIAGAVVWIGIVVAFVAAAVTERRRRRGPRAPTAPAIPDAAAP